MLVGDIKVRSVHDIWKNTLIFESEIEVINTNQSRKWGRVKVKVNLKNNNDNKQDVGHIIINNIDVFIFNLFVNVILFIWRLSNINILNNTNDIYVNVNVFIFNISWVIICNIICINHLISANIIKNNLNNNISSNNDKSNVIITNISVIIISNLSNIYIH